MNKFICIRTYNSGDFKAFFADTQEEVDKWIADNSVMRFGCSMIVDGEIRYKGYTHSATPEVVDAAIAKAGTDWKSFYHVERDNPNGFVRAKLKYPNDFVYLRDYCT